MIKELAFGLNNRHHFVQEECPNLRGEKWYERHKRADNIRKEISVL